MPLLRHFDTGRRLCAPLAHFQQITSLSIFMLSARALPRCREIAAFDFHVTAPFPMMPNYRHAYFADKPDGWRDFDA